MPHFARTASANASPYDFSGSLAIGLFQFHFTLQNPLDYPDAAESVWRGTLGHALRTLLCHTPQQSCGHCLLRRKCAFSIVFENSYMREHQKGPLSVEPPPPITLYSVSPSGHYHEGDTLSIELVLIAEQQAILPAIVSALDRVVLQFKGQEAVTASLSEVTHIKETTQFSQQPIWNGNWQLPNSIASQIDMPEWLLRNDRVRLRWLTPAVLKHRGAPITENLTLQQMMTMLLRRFTLLQSYWTQQNLPNSDEISDWLSAIEQVQLQFKPWAGTRRSRQQNRHMHFQGIAGEAEIETQSIQHLLALLWMGQWLHLGKGASFGMGRYQLLPVNNTFG